MAKMHIFAKLLIACARLFENIQGFPNVPIDIKQQCQNVCECSGGVVISTNAVPCVEVVCMEIRCDENTVIYCPVGNLIARNLCAQPCKNCTTPTTSNIATSGSTTVPATTTPTTSNNVTSGSTTVPATTTPTTSNNVTSGSTTVPATTTPTTTNNVTSGSTTVPATTTTTISINGTSGSTTAPVTASTKNHIICTSSSTDPITTLLSTPSKSPVNNTENALESVHNLQSIVIGLSVCSIILTVTVLVTGVLLWKRCRTPKSAPSTSVTSSKIGVNESDLITTPFSREYNYDQIVIENTQDSLYTPPAKISDNQSKTESNTAKKLEVDDNHNRTTNICQDYMKLREVTRDMNTDYHKLTPNNIPNESDNPSDLGKIDDGSVGFVENYQKPNHESVYFELEKSDDMYEKSYKKPADTRISLNLTENLVVFSNLTKMNTDAESNMPSPLNLTSCNTSSLQFRNDNSTYFELEKLEEDASNDQSEPMSTDQYSKLREVTRDFGHDYNKLSSLDASPEHGQTNNT